MAEERLPSPTDPSDDMGDDIDVTLLLEGGHHHTLRLDPQAALLRQLMGSLTDPIADRSRRLFQIPLGEGQALLSFPGDRLVGIITDPPVVIPSATLADGSALGTSPLGASPVGDRVIPCQMVQLADFLTAAEHQYVLDWAIAQAPAFVPSTTSTNAIDYRKSMVLYHLPDIEVLFHDRIQAILPDVLRQLAIAPFVPSQIETQLTAHNDGHYYQIHNDNGSPDTSTRQLTYVYYFHQTPKAFTGGELRLYDSLVRRNVYVQSESFRLVEPSDNSIVFFPSHYMHEVLPISCPSRAFTDSRFTINGWIRA